MAYRDQISLIIRLHESVYAPGPGKFTQPVVQTTILRGYVRQRKKVVLPAISVNLILVAQAEFPST